MKKIILIFTLLACLKIYSQDLQTIELLTNSKTIDQVKNTSDKIAASAEVKFEYYKTKDRNLREEKYKVIIYTPASFTEEDKKEFSDEEKAQCLQVTWLVTDTGYVFKEVTNSENNISAFWKQTFTSVENEYRVSKDLKYKYVKNENSVSIVKSY